MLTFQEMPIELRRELVEEMAQLLIVAECERLMLACPNADITQEVANRMERYREVLIAALTRNGD